jgi:hypothetical protein
MTPTLTSTPTPTPTPTWTPPAPLTWDSSSIATSSYSDLSKFGYYNGNYVGLGVSCGYAVYSSDGVNWSINSLPAGAAGTNYSDIASGPTFVAVSYAGTNRILTSTDGINWTARAAPQANTWYGVGYGNGTYVAVSFAGTNRVITSTDGITWTLRTAASAQSWYRVAYGNSIFVVTSYSATAYQTSPNGTTWTGRTFPYAGINLVKFGNGVFVAAGGTFVYTSTNGTTWTLVSLSIFGGNDSVLGLNFANGKFAIAGSKKIIFSTDGTNWSNPYSIPVRGDSLAGLNDRFIISSYPASSTSPTLYYSGGV